MISQLPCSSTAQMHGGNVPYTCFSVRVCDLVSAEVFSARFSSDEEQ